MRTYRLFEFLLPALAAVLLTACGGGNNPKASVSASQTPGKAAPSVKVSRSNPCSVMMPNEVGEILGLPSQMREVMDEVTCRYHFEPPAGSRPKAAGQETFIEVKVHWTGGRATVTATRLAGKLLGSGSSAFEKVPDVGDEAWLAPMAAFLAFSKSDVGVEIDMRMLPGEKEKTIRLARLIASRV